MDTSRTPPGMAKGLSARLYNASSGQKSLARRKRDMNRRYFFMSTAAAVTSRALRSQNSPNNTVRVAVGGNGARGASHMGAWTSQTKGELAALVDVAASHTEPY